MPLDLKHCENIICSELLSIVWIDISTVVIYAKQIDRLWLDFVVIMIVIVIIDIHNFLFTSKEIEISTF